MLLLPHTAQKEFLAKCSFLIRLHSGDLGTPRVDTKILLKKPVSTLLQSKSHAFAGVAFCVMEITLS